MAEYMGGSCSISPRKAGSTASSSALVGRRPVLSSTRPVVSRVSVTRPGRRRAV